MSDDRLRSVQLTRRAHGHYRATNARGVVIETSPEGETHFTPVELLLAAIAGCTAIDVDFITSKRSEPTRFELSMRADKIRDEGGNHLVDLSLTFRVEFPDDEAGRAAAAVLPSAVQRSHDRLCTVSRTVELGTPVDVTIA
jgi:putative redox protein